MPCFTVPGKPYAKKRPRFSNRNRRAYNPASNARAEHEIGFIALPHFPRPIQGPVRLTIFVAFEPAASWTKKRKAEAIGRPHTQKPDLDNVEKWVCDGLNGIAWVDDSQVADVRKSKVWAHRSETTVVVEEMG